MPEPRTPGGGGRVPSLPGHILDWPIPYILYMRCLRIIQDFKSRWYLDTTSFIGIGPIHCWALVPKICTLVVRCYARMRGEIDAINVDLAT